VVYTVTATVSPTAAGALTNAATIAAPVGVYDPASGDNASTDAATIQPSPNTTPAISDLGNQTTQVGTVIGPIGFTVGDAETTPDALGVTAAFDNPTPLPAAGIVLAGSGANRTVTITLVAGQTGAATITVTVSDPNGLTASNTFTVTVTPVAANSAPTISDIGDQSSAGSPVGPVAFAVGDAETVPADLTLSAASSNPALLPAAKVDLRGDRAGSLAHSHPGRRADRDGGRHRHRFGRVTATGTFTVTVTPAGGNTPPAISDIGDQTAAIDTAVGPIGFTLGDTQTTAGDLFVTAVSSNPALVPNGTIILGGSGANRTLNITPAPGQTAG
jgi:hypothetical protein